MKKLHIYFLVGVGIFIIILLSPAFTIKDVQVEGLKRVSKDDIIKTLNINNKSNLISFTRFRAKKKLKNNYYIEDISIKKEFPNKLILYVKERDLVGYIKHTNGYIMIDKYGFVVDIKKEYKEKLPLIEGLNFETFILGQKLIPKDPQKLKAVVEIAMLALEKKLSDAINVININNINNIHIYIDNIDVVFGSASSIATKISTLSAINEKFKVTEKGILYLDDTSKSPVFKYIT